MPTTTKEVKALHQVQLQLLYFIFFQTELGKQKWLNLQEEVVAPNSKTLADAINSNPSLNWATIIFLATNLSLDS